MLARHSTHICTHAHTLALFLIKNSNLPSWLFVIKAVSFKNGGRCLLEERENHRQTDKGRRKERRARVDKKHQINAGAALRYGHCDAAK